MSTPFWKDLPPGFHQRRCAVDSELGFEVFVWRGDEADEKTLLLNGATHGDEWEGPTVLTELAQNFRPENLRGTVVIIPVLHEAAFFACTRESPFDGKNLARVFPGDENGTPTEKIAYAFGSRFIEHASFYVDIHSAGAAYEIFPWAGYTMHDNASTLATQRAMAKCFPKLWQWGTPYLPGRTISAAHEHNVPAIYLECEGKGGVEASDLKILRAGFDNLLKQFGFIEGEAELHELIGVRESTDGEEGHLQVENPAPCDGILMEIISAGARVNTGETIAIVQPLDGSTLQTVLAEKNGRAILVRRFRAVKKGEALAAIVDF